ncbi:MAG: copper chaperone [Rhodothermales bacterium]|nr:copper chaperone [Rhodothermales bacterium]
MTMTIRAMSTVELQIEGMSCNHCVAAVREALVAVDNVSSADVKIGSARVHSVADLNVDALQASIEEEGYSVTAVSRVDS